MQVSVTVLEAAVVLAGGGQAVSLRSCCINSVDPQSKGLLGSQSPVSAQLPLPVVAVDIRVVLLALAVQTSG